jgi:exopolysaccharide biosynthesis polyprenyl glycosylphosphotransferase
MEADVSTEHLGQTATAYPVGGRENLRRPVRPVREAQVLDEEPFLRQLQLEKRRSDRSHRPLSLVLLDVDIEQRDGLRVFRELAQVVFQIKRETDLLGYLGDDRLAIMLLDTGSEGMRAFLHKIAERTHSLAYRVTCATYPDRLFETLTTGVEHGMHALFVDDAMRRDPMGSLAKRAVDVAGSLGALIALSPLLLLTALAVKLSSPGPVIFRQQRVGKGGVPFTFYKFRSMRADSDDRIHREYVSKLIEGDHEAVNQGDAGQPHFKIKADPRVTAVGRFIRRTSIDELPQLFNVLKGDMSLVGPRPPLPYEAEKYKSWHLRRVLEIRPGITGLWQVEGRNKTTFDDMVRLDLRYIREWSPMLDARLLLRTVAVVLRGKGDE